MPKLLFLDGLERGNLTERQKHLRNGYIRSHMMRQVHERKKGQVVIRRTNEGQNETEDALRNEPVFELEQVEGPLLLQLDLDKLAPVFRSVSEMATTSYSKALRVRNIMTPEFLRLMSDEALYHTGSALVKHEHQNLIEPGHQTREVLIHRSKALQIIQKRLQQSAIVDNATLLAILFLPSSEDGAGSIEDFKIHFKGVSHLIAARREIGDIRDSPGGAFTSDYIDLIGPFAKLKLGIDIPHSDGRTQEELIAANAPSREEELELAKTTNLPLGFQDLVDQKLIGVSCMRLIQNYVCNVQYTMSDNHGETLANDFQNSYSRFHIKSSSVPGEPSIEQILSEALMLYTGRSLGPVSTVGLVARSLRQSLSREILFFATVRRAAEERALYWAWTLSVASWKTITGNLAKEGSKLLERQVIRFPHWTADAKASRGVLQFFLYDEQLLKDHDRFMQPYRTST